MVPYCMYFYLDNEVVLGSVAGVNYRYTLYCMNWQELDMTKGLRALLVVPVLNVLHDL